MAHSERPSFDIGHPAPDRRRVGALALLFSLVGGAAAWSLQLTAVSAMAIALCSSGAAGGSTTVANAGSIQTALLAVNLVALLIAGLALFQAYRCLEATGHIRDGHTLGLLDAGEGRTRFLAIWAIFSSTLFLIAILANSVSLSWSRLC